MGQISKCVKGDGVGYRERITEITGRLMAGETDRGAAAKELWVLLASAIAEGDGSVHVVETIDLLLQKRG